ncbi:MAG: hypothetical protein DMG28_08440 [Acidobacteria bacterium]|nr:MAG: hypothetical protein DMG28_08440 [Acidobacteriota bacterium]
MPMGPGPIGFATFVAVKWAGYTGTAYALRLAYAAPSASVLKVGSTRTAVGIGAGLAYGALWLSGLPKMGAHLADVYYFVFLLPVRMAEWSFVLWLFFDRKLADHWRLLRFATYGSGWSYVLDAVAVGTALVVPGGVWVC